MEGGRGSTGKEREYDDDDDKNGFWGHRDQMCLESR